MPFKPWSGARAKLLPGAVVMLLVAGVVASTAWSENFPQFRGATADAVSPNRLPTRWAAGESPVNLRWQVPVEGEGWSQPIVWGDRVYLTAAVPREAAARERSRPETNRGGYGRDRPDLVNVEYEYRVHCLDADSGQTLWTRVVKTGKPPLPRHSTNTYATETPATDGTFIYAYFGMNGVYCLDAEGELIWSRDLGVYEMRAGWGTASSPLLHEGRLFLQVDNQEQSFVTALDAATGKPLWRTDRDESSQYSSPFLWQNSLRDELILGGTVSRSYDPATGEVLWSLDMNKGRSSATPVAIGDRLFVGNEFRNRGGDDDGGGRLYAVRPGGRGDITPPGDALTSEFIVWRMDESNIQMASPAVCGGNLYFLQRRRGLLTCVDAETGRVEYTERVRGADAFWSSPWTDGVNVFALDATGNTHVIPCGDRFEIRATNRLDEQTWGTPALSGGRIYLRTVAHLYCIEDGSEANTSDGANRPGERRP